MDKQNNIIIMPISPDNNYELTTLSTALEVMQNKTTKLQHATSFGSTHNKKEYFWIFSVGTIRNLSHLGIEWSYKADFSSAYSIPLG